MKLELHIKMAIIGYQMLEFKEVFPRGTVISTKNENDILNCKNIDFNHCEWTYNVLSNYTVLCHIVDNIVNINANEYILNKLSHVPHISHISRTLLRNITEIVTRDNTNIKLINYILNNGHVTSDTLDVRNICGYQTEIMLRKYANLVIYLTKVSLSKFTGFYNIEKYYYMINTMLLILNTQKVLPKNIVKHVIVPFIYQ